MNYDFMSVFENHHEQIYNDYLSVKNKLSPYPETNLYNKGWDVFGIFLSPTMQKYLTSEDHVPIQESECSFTRKLIKEHIPSHGTAGFSILKAGTALSPN